MFKLPNMYVCKCLTTKNKNCQVMDCKKLNYPYYRDYRENFYLNKLIKSYLQKDSYPPLQLMEKLESLVHIGILLKHLTNL